MKKLWITLLVILWSLNIQSQDLTYCGDGYFIDLNVGYSPTGFGLQLCGCSGETSNCELVHIILRRGNSDDPQLLNCPNIVLTERWWRERKDLVDIYDANTCEEISESPDFDDRYEISTSIYDPGDTISILVCKTNPDDLNIISLSASPGAECSELSCKPQISCPVEYQLRKNLDCIYVLPDFRDDVVLYDTCSDPITDVTASYVLRQNPQPGETISNDLFVEITATNNEGVVVTTCDISILLTADMAPTIMEPSYIEDISSWAPFPQFENLVALDTTALDSVIIIETIKSIDPYNKNACEGYSVTYRWTAVDTCGLISEETMSFNVLPDLDRPIFASLPADIDTIFVGQSLPLLVDLVAINPDGTVDGILLDKYIDPYEVDECYGYDVTYHWTATDSCENTTELSKSFFVEPTGDPPVFITIPDAINDVYGNDSLPAPQELIATSSTGDTLGIMVVHSIDDYESQDCNPYEVTYRWTAIDTCGISSTILQSFYVIPDTLPGSLLVGIPDLMIQITLECEESAAIEIPIDLEQHSDKIITIIITDDNWNELDQYLYSGPQEYEFGMGEFHVIYSIINNCNSEIRDTIDVDAIDISSPVFICDENQHIVIADLSSCAATASWQVPLAFDNCEGIEIEQTSGPDIGAIVGIGTYDITYTATDASQNVSECNFQFIVSPTIDFSIQCLPVSLELDSLCQATLTKEAIIGTDILICSPDFELSVIAGLDTLTGDTIEIGAYFGQPISYVLCDPLRDICCQNSVELTDNSIPVISCKDTITLSCLNDLETYRPQVTGICGPVIWDTRDLNINETCHDSLHQRTITREFIAISHTGNASLPCTTNILITYANLDSLYQNNQITFPNDTTLSCEDFDIASVSLEHFGSPLLDGIKLTLEPNACGIKANFEDEIYLDYGCTKIIKRHWTIDEELCGYNSRKLEKLQIIRIEDSEGPVLDTSNSAIIVNTTVHNCQGYFKIENLRYSDNCQDSSLINYYADFNSIHYFQEDSISLGVGTHFVQIISEDGCRNLSRDTISVTVVDRVRPVAACLEHTIVSINEEPIKFPASALDIGSYDNCAIAEIKIRKAYATCSEQDLIFDDYVQFCCNDVGKSIEVILLTIDHDGNENYCSGTITIQDKIAPTISCPPDLVLDCSIALSLSNNELDPYGHIFGKVTTVDLRGPINLNEDLVISSDGPLIDGVVSDNCRASIKIEVATKSDLNQCGVGIITRSFTAYDNVGNKSATCTQTIEIVAGPNLDTNSIKWPEEYILIEECKTVAPFSPEELGRPVIDKTSCQLIGISHEDEYVKISEVQGGVCGKLIRRWTIIDWCNPYPLESKHGRNQIIKIADSEYPQFLNCDEDDQLFRVSTDNCNTGQIIIRKSGSDNCTEVADLKWNLKIDFHNDGINDISTFPSRDSSGVYFKQNIPYGRHKVVWEITDRCDNVNVCTEFISVENSLLPIIKAHGASVVLDAGGKVVIGVDDLINKVEHPCNSDISISIGKENGWHENSSANVHFSCDDVGSNIIKVYAAIVLNNGEVLYSFVSVIVEINDDGICNNVIGTLPKEGLSTGLVYTEKGKLVPGVQLELFKAEEDLLIATNISDNQGVYNLGNLKRGYSYLLFPSLKGDYLEGLSTLDIVLIQRHILGLNLLDSPYKMIGSDVNGDNKISVFDILDMRRAILRLPSSLEQHNAWRFIDADTQFDDELFPFSEGTIEQIPINFDSCTKDVLAIKMGDINESALIENVDIADNRNTEILHISDFDFSAGQEFHVSLSLKEGMDIFGYQAGFNYDQDKLEFLDYISGHERLSTEINNVDDGHVLISSSNGQSVSLMEGESLAVIAFRTIGSGQLSKSLKLSQEYLRPEIYTNNLEAQSLALDFAPIINNVKIKSNNPNPFTEFTELEIYSSDLKIVNLSIFNTTGKKITHRKIELGPGKNSIYIHRDELGTAGLYYFIIEDVAYRYTGKMVLID